MILAEQPIHYMNLHYTPEVAKLPTSDCPTWFDLIIISDFIGIDLTDQTICNCRLIENVAL